MFYEEIYFALSNDLIASESVEVQTNMKCIMNEHPVRVFTKTCKDDWNDSCVLVSLTPLRVSNFLPPVPRTLSSQIKSQ